MKIDLQLADSFFKKADLSYLCRLFRYLKEVKESPDISVFSSKSEIEALCDLVESKIKEKEKETK